MLFRGNINFKISIIRLQIFNQENIMKTQNINFKFKFYLLAFFFFYSKSLIADNLNNFDSDKPVVTYNTEYSQDFSTNQWDNTKFYNQWFAIVNNNFSATDISEGYLKFIWTDKRIICSISGYSSPYKVNAKIQYGGASNRGGIVIRVKELSDNLQEPPSDPGFNRMGIAMYPSDGSNYCVQFSGIEAGTTTARKQIIIPKPATVNNLMSEANTLQIEDFGNKIYIYINNLPFFKIELSGLINGIYSAGNVYDANSTLIDSFSNMVIPAFGKVAVAQRDAELHLHSISINSVTKDIAYDKPTPVLTTLYQMQGSDTFNQTNFDATWDVISSFTADNTQNDYWKLGWLSPRVLRTKQAFNFPYILEAELSLSNPTVRGGVVIRAPQNGDAEDLQETAQNTVLPMFNRAGIAFFPNSSGTEMYVQFSGTVNGYSTPYNRITVPAPSGINLRNKCTLKIEDYGSVIYVFVNNQSLCRINFNENSTELDASGTVFNSGMVIQGVFHNMIVPETDFKIGVAARDDIANTDDLRLYTLKISSAQTQPLSPTNVNAIAGNAKATVTFVSDANTSLTYTVKSYPEGITATGSSSPIIVSGLSNGQSYSFTVTATNNVGSSLESEHSNIVTPQSTVIQLSTKTNQWTGTDALGRKLPDNLLVGSPKKNKIVGLFYWTWHTDNLADYSPVMNITEIVKQYPEAMSDFNHPAWNSTSEGGVYWWDEPLFGYYRTTDDWVLRKHAEMLADAGVDVVFFDCTNGSQTWKSSYMKLLQVWSDARIDGVNTPQIAFMLPFGATKDAVLSLNELYSDLYLPELYKDLWFMWEGKPLVMAYPEMQPQQGNTAGMKFTASSGFQAINVQCPSWANSIGNLTLSMYKWDTNYAVSTAGTPIATRTFVNFIDNSKLTLEFDNQLAGDYVWELNEGTEVVGVWKWTDSTDPVTCFFDGNVINQKYNAEISYGSTSNFTNLTNGTQHEPLQIFGTKVEQARIDNMKNFFTFRPGQPDMVYGSTRNDHWGWLEVAPQHGFVKKANGKYEQATVGVAQNASDASGGHACAFNSELTYGRSYTKDSGHDTSENAYYKGLNFQEQWNNAFKIDPDFIFVTGWNEWIGGRWTSWDVKPFSFVDTYSAEKSRDVEPVKSWGSKGDVYYMQLISNIRKFKGVDVADTTSNAKTIDIQKLSDWDNVYPAYQSYKGNTMHRNHAGQGKSLVYTNNTGRNDIIEAKVARNSENIYFYVRTNDPLSDKNNQGWMRLFIDIDRNKETGWEGYDYVVNRVSPTSTAVIEKNKNNTWEWEQAGTCDYAIISSVLTLKINKSALGIQQEQLLDFEFKWSDNMQENGNIMDFYVNGDVAPTGRFNYIYNQTKTDDNYLLPVYPENINQGILRQLFTGTFDTIPDFSTIEADTTNYLNTFDLTDNSISNFGLRFLGFIDAPEKDNYTFYVNSDTEARLIIDNQVVVRSALSVENSGSIKLMPGKHTLCIDYITKTPTTKLLDINVEATSFPKMKLPETVIYKYNISPEGTLTLAPVQKFYSITDSVYNVNATDIDGSIVKTEIYDNNQLVNEIISGSTQKTTFSTGSHKVYAKVFDNNGSSIITNQLMFDVVKTPALPCTIRTDSFCVGYNTTTINTTHPDGGKDIRSTYGWTEYYVDAPTAGSYKLTICVPASTNRTRIISIKQNGLEIGNFNISNIGNSQAWYDISADIQLLEGIQKLHFDFTGIVQLHKIKFDFTSLIKTISSPSIKIMPNPSNSFFTIYTADPIQSVSVFDLAGSKLENIIINGTQNSVKLGYTLQQGIYLIGIKSTNGTYSINKIIKN